MKKPTQKQTPSKNEWAFTLTAYLLTAILMLGLGGMHTTAFSLPTMFMESRI